MCNHGTVTKVLLECSFIFLFSYFFPDRRCLQKLWASWNRKLSLQKATSSYSEIQKHSGSETPKQLPVKALITWFTGWEELGIRSELSTWFSNEFLLLKKIGQVLGFLPLLRNSSYRKSIVWIIHVSAPKTSQQEKQKIKTWSSFAISWCFSLFFQPFSKTQINYNSKQNLYL